MCTTVLCDFLQLIVNIIAFNYLVSTGQFRQCCDSCDLLKTTLFAHTTFLPIVDCLFISDAIKQKYEKALE